MHLPGGGDVARPARASERDPLETAYDDVPGNPLPEPEPPKGPGWAWLVPAALFAGFLLYRLHRWLA